jgi:hypothetical protein
VEQIQNRKTIRGRTHYLVLWKGQSSSNDSWEPVEHLTNCAERLAEYEAAAPRRPKARRAATQQTQARGGAPSAPSAPPSPLPSPPTGWSLGAWAQPAVGDAVLYWWLEACWQRGRVARLAMRAPFTHVVRYRRPAAAFTGEFDTLLDTASYNVRWARLVTTSADPRPKSALPSAFDRAGSKRREEASLASDSDAARASVALDRNQRI